MQGREDAPRKLWKSTMAKMSRPMTAPPVMRRRGPCEGQKSGCSIKRIFSSAARSVLRCCCTSSDMSRVWLRALALDTVSQQQGSYKAPRAEKEAENNSP